MVTKHPDCILYTSPATKHTGKKLGEQVSDKLKEFFENNKKVFIWIGVGVALLVLLGAGISSCSMLTSTGSSVIASSYLRLLYQLS